MSFMKTISTAALVAVVSAGSAFAVPIAAGSFQATGLYSSDITPVAPGAEISLTSGVILLSDGGFTGIGGLDISGFNPTIVTDNTNDGLSFTADLGGDTLTFTITDTVIATVDPSVGNPLLGAFDIAGIMSVTSTVFDDFEASFQIAASTLQTTGLYTLTVVTPPITFTPPPAIPLPAGVVLLGGGLAALGVARRVQKKA